MLPILLDFDETLASKTQGGLTLPAPELDGFNRLCQTLQSDHHIIPQLVISTGRNAKAIANFVSKLPEQDPQRQAFQGLMLTAIATQNGSLCVEKPADMDNLQFLIQVSHVEEAYNQGKPLTPALLESATLNDHQKQGLIDSANQYLAFVQDTLQAKSGKTERIAWHPTDIGQALRQSLRMGGFTQQTGESDIVQQLQARRGAKDVVPVDAVFLAPLESNPSVQEAVLFFKGQPLSPQLTWVQPHNDASSEVGSALEVERSMTLPLTTLQQSIRKVETLFAESLREQLGSSVVSPKLNHKNEPVQGQETQAHLFHDGHWNRAYYELNPFGEEGKGQVLNYWVNLQHRQNKHMPLIVTAGDAANDYSALACETVKPQESNSVVANLAFLVDRNNSVLNKLKTQTHPTLANLMEECACVCYTLPKALGSWSRLQTIGTGQTKQTFGTPEQLLARVIEALKYFT